MRKKYADLHYGQIPTLKKAIRDELSQSGIAAIYSLMRCFTYAFSFIGGPVFNFLSFPSRLETGNKVHIEVWGTATSTSDNVYAKIIVWQYDSDQSPVRYSGTVTYHMPGF